MRFFLIEVESGTPVFVSCEYVTPENLTVAELELYRRGDVKEAEKFAEIFSDCDLEGLAGNWIKLTPEHPQIARDCECDAPVNAYFLVLQIENDATEQSNAN